MWISRYTWLFAVVEAVIGMTRKHQTGIKGIYVPTFTTARHSLGCRVLTMAGPLAEGARFVMSPHMDETQLGLLLQSAW